jgi:hypothetical protein
VTSERRYNDKDHHDDNNTEQRITPSKPRSNYGIIYDRKVTRTHHLLNTRTPEYVLVSIQIDKCVCMRSHRSSGEQARGEEKRRRFAVWIQIQIQIQIQR